MKAFEFKPKLFTTLKNYSKESFMADLMAGIIVGIVALPLAIAFGIASGVSPEKGIITAIVAGFIISLFGRKAKYKSDGPNRARYRYHLRYHTRIWHQRTDSGNTDGRCTPCFIRSV